MKQFNLLKSVLMSRNPHCKEKPWDHGGDSAADLENIKELYQRSLRFDHCLEHLRIQLRYSVLALLSENKVSIFNEDLIELMNILQQDFNSTDEDADYGSFLLDRMHMTLNPKDNPYEDLRTKFNE